MGDFEKIRDGMSIAALLTSGVVLLFGAAVALFLTGYCDGSCDRRGIRWSACSRCPSSGAVCCCWAAPFT